MDNQITRRYKKCEVCGVRRLPKSNVILCNFPLDPTRCRRWVKAVGNPDLLYVPIEKLHELKFICNSHFTRDSFNAKGNRLLKTAVPTLNLVLQPLADELFKDFPLHVRSYYEKKENFSEIEPLSTVSSEIIPVASTSRAPMHMTYKRKVDILKDSTNVIMSPVKSQPGSSTRLLQKHEMDNVQVDQVEPLSIMSSKIIPVTSTSRAPMHMTYETKVVESLSTVSSEIIPVASTSRAPMHMTYERKVDIFKDSTNVESPTRTDLLQKQDIDNVQVNQDEFQKQDNLDTVMVESYKRKKSVSFTHGGGHNMSNKEKKILKRLQESKVTIKMLSKTLINLDKLESETLKNIVENALKNQKRPRQGKRWDLKNKILALSIFKRSPKAYRYMQNMLPLPSSRTLQRVLKEIPMEPGIHHSTISLLKKKGEEMEENDKHCVLLFDEMALKKRLIFNESLDKVEGYVDLGKMGRENKIAGHVLVFMIQGLKIKFKQPIGHFFVEGTIQTEKLAVIIKDIIRVINEANFSVIATVCDQGPTNIGALNLLKKNDCVSVEENYFNLDNKKVYIIFDIPHLFKSIRNNFFQAGTMLYKGKTAKWSNLKEAEERNRSFLNFKNITPLVVNPTYKIKMRVKYAAHALSNTMKAVLKMLAMSCNNDYKRNELFQTAYVVEEMDKLFDVTNGPASPNDIKKGIRENVSKKTQHLESWNYYLKHMDTIKFLKSDSQLQLRNVRCIKGFKITLKSLKDIWNMLSKNNYKYLNLRQLNQDSLENLFGNIRQHSVTNKNPTCSHFNAALKTTILAGLTGPHSRGSNCINDTNKVLVTYKEIFKTDCIQELELQENCLVEDSSYPVLSIPDDHEIESFEKNFNSFEDQPIVYVSGYLAAKVIKNNSCEVCSGSIIEKHPNPADPLYTYISLREWWPEQTSLTYPKKEFVIMISEAKNVFENEIVPHLHKDNIGQWCMLLLSTKIDMNWYKCAAHLTIVKDFLFKFISKLFIRKSCKIINSTFITSENDMADKVKKAQQANKDK